MHRIIILFFALITGTTSADTIDHFINIANTIPQMEMKADPQAQAWARSARTVLTLTGECIAETLTASNEAAGKTGTPFFCLPAGVTLNALTLNELIQQTYSEISSQSSDKNKMTVSQVALLGLKKQYPCTPPKGSNKIAHVEQWLTGIKTNG